MYIFKNLLTIITAQKAVKNHQIHFANVWYKLRVIYFVGFGLWDW